MGAESEHLEAIAEMGNNIEAVGADRAGGAEDDESAAGSGHVLVGVPGHEAPKLVTTVTVPIILMVLYGWHCSPCAVKAAIQRLGKPGE